MGLFGKIKDILFEEEEELEVEEPKKEEKKKVEVIKEEPKEVKVAPKIEEERAVETPKIEKNPFVEQDIPKREEFLGERDILSNEKTSPFLDFDEEEFSNLLVKPKPKTTNVLEYERKKKTEKRIDYGRYEKTEIKETVEKKKFKPSPIISPVYGILNEDYRIEDIKSKDDEIDLDIDKVRKKAFEPKEELKEPVVDIYDEETVTVKYEEPDEKIQKGKTIDDLLEDTTDEIINLDGDEKNDSRIEYEEIEDNMDFDDLEKEEETIPEEIPEEKTKKEKKEKLEDTKEIELEPTDNDNMESDLFDLIDSMYENREDGE